MEGCKPIDVSQHGSNSLERILKSFQTGQIGVEYFITKSQMQAWFVLLIIDCPYQIYHRELIKYKKTNKPIHVLKAIKIKLNLLFAFNIFSSNSNISNLTFK